ncbi:MAG: hypothetical protein RMX68_006050 [Aulosira sp. ZfuVER01]|nr:hypothetical protein [Aulosira sp. ZfuVER01]MDZ8001486.1 hypothetical protein [Aulosira sp. DedVER01a]MDZ8051646.1 hypothetical protein [Aulosira sp. ZfuCHP01]
MSNQIVLRLDRFFDWSQMYRRLLLAGFWNWEAIAKLKTLLASEQDTIA